MGPRGQCMFFVLCGIISAFLLCLCWSQRAKLVQQNLRLFWYLPAMLCLWYLHLEDLFPASGLFSSSNCKLSLIHYLKKMTCFRNNPSYFRRLFLYTERSGKREPQLNIVKDGTAILECRHWEHKRAYLPAFFPVEWPTIIAMFELTWNFKEYMK